MTYDALNRLVNTSKQLKNSLVNNNAETGVINVSSMQYDALGQLKVKNLGNTRSGSNYTGSPLDIQTYEYNIRGWLLGINRNFITTQPSSNNSNILGESFTTPPSYTAGNYFGFELAYDNNGVLGNYNHLYNGNISGMSWKSIHDEQVRKYDFTYDEANRLKTADFNQFTSGYFNKNAGVNYSVNNLNYDKNGNILSMNQMGLRTLTATNSALVDQLSYAYQSGSNKLAKVTDAALANGNVLGDFQDGTNDGDDYTYDANGNLISDANKGISSIQYNYLNLPQTISMTGKGTISFTYDAAGNKLQKLVVDNTNGTTTTTQYLGGLIYQNDVLQYIAQEEGRIRINANNNDFIFDYFLKDHLGNTRMTITDDNNAASPVIDATSYYPFGLTMAGISSKAAGKLENKYKYNGKEIQHLEFSNGSGIETYDFGARQYDQQIGMWRTIDPKADLSRRWSTYNYAYDNPIRYLDSDGMTSQSFDDHYKKNGKEIAVVRTQDKYDRTLNVTKGDIKVNTDAIGNDWVSSKGLESSITEIRTKSGEITYSKTDYVNSEPLGENKGIENSTEKGKIVMDVLDNTAIKSIELGGKYGGAKSVESFGVKASTTLAGSALLLTAVDATANGLQLKHTIDGVLTGISIAQPEVAPFIFVANLLFMAANGGKGIAETIQESAKSNGISTQYSKPVF